MKNLFNFIILILILLVLVLLVSIFFGDKNYTSKSRWGKKQVEKSIEYLEIYNKIKSLN